jgi:hypothetical protein
VYYKPNLDESIERYRKLWAREAQDRILVKIDVQVPANSSVMKAMASVPNRERMLEEWEKGFAANRDVADDNLPVVYGEYGGYIIGGFLGAQVLWGGGGAYPEKLITDMKRYPEYLHFDENNEYFRMQLEYLKFLGERSEGRFGYTEMIAVDGLNFMDCVRGADAYTDVFDHPREITEIMDFASDLNVRLIRAQRALMKPCRGGRFNFYQIWTPGETVFISVDAYGQCGPEVFEKFGRKYVQRLADEFGAGWLHVHSDAMRLLPNYACLRNVIAIGLEDWIKPPRAIDHLEEIQDVTGDAPLMINITRDEFIQKIEAKSLPGNILYWVSGIGSASDANDVARIAYEYRAKYRRRSF